VALEAAFTVFILEWMEEPVDRETVGDIMKEVCAVFYFLCGFFLGEKIVEVCFG